MARQYGQAPVEVFRLTSGCFTAAGASSGSATSLGYARLVGFFRTDVDIESGSGLLIRQSVDGANWDYVSASDFVEASGAGSAACAVDILGDGIRVDVSNGSTEASAMRYGFWLLPE